MATAQLYGKAGANFLGGEAGGDTLATDWLSDTIQATLHTTTYTPNIDTHELAADLTNEVANANGYTTGGVTLASKTVSYNATGNVTTFGCATFSWTASGGDIQFRYVVVWNTTPVGDPLIGYVDYGSTQTIANGNTGQFTNASGLFTGTVT